MPWLRISEHRYENTELNQYTTYAPATDTHLDFWYLHDGTSDKTLNGSVDPADFGIPPDVINSNVQVEPPGIGHNAAPAAPAIERAPLAAERLRSLVDRIERLEEERKVVATDIKDIFHEAKSAGFDVKVLRTLLRLRRRDPAEIEEMENLLDLYRRALGM